MVLIGHSTGCQDAVRYVSLHSQDTDAAKLAGVVLQAAVSSKHMLLHPHPQSIYWYHHKWASSISDRCNVLTAANILWSSNVLNVHDCGDTLSMHALEFAAV